MAKVCPRPKLLLEAQSDMADSKEQATSVFAPFSTPERAAEGAVDVQIRPLSGLQLA